MSRITQLSQAFGSAMSTVKSPKRAPPPPRQGQEQEDEGKRHGAASVGFRHGGSVYMPGPGIDAYHHVESKAMDDVYKAGKVPMGKLKILPPKPGRAGADQGITDAYGVVHMQHVKYDPKSRKYEGLPPEWAKMMKRQFGLGPKEVEVVAVDGYAARIPAVLVELKDHLVRGGGLKSEGIFRLAPDQEQAAQIKQQLNEGVFKGCHDVNIMANLIKVWFRESPAHVIDPLGNEGIDRASKDEETAGRAVQQLPEPQQSIFLWLLDLCLLVEEHKADNKMSAKALAIVIAPNLFTPTQTNPMLVIQFSHSVAGFLFHAIRWRQDQLKRTK